MGVNRQVFSRNPLGQVLSYSVVPRGIPPQNLFVDNFLRYHFQPFSLNLVLPSVVKPSGVIAQRGTRHLT